MIQNIDFNEFANQLYSESNNKIAIQVDIEDGSESNIYDIHMMLIDLIIFGLHYFSLNLNEQNYEEIIHYLQKFFNKINIKILVQKYTEQELDIFNNDYVNRFMKLYKSEQIILNGAHKKVSSLKDIKSFYIENNYFNLSFYFEFG